MAVLTSSFIRFENGVKATVKNVADHPIPLHTPLIKTANWMVPNDPSSVDRKLTLRIKLPV